MEGLYWNGVDLRRRVLHYLFSILKTGSFQCRLHFRKKPEVVRSHDRRMGSWWTPRKSKSGARTVLEHYHDATDSFSPFRGLVLCAELHHGVGEELFDNTLLSLFVPPNSWIPSGLWPPRKLVTLHCCAAIFESHWSTDTRSVSVYYSANHRLSEPRATVYIRIMLWVNLL